MCENYIPYDAAVQRNNSARKALNLLLLDCWQREYDKRPYRRFRFDRKDFEERMKRAYKSTSDFGVIVKFLQNRSLRSAFFQGFRISRLKSLWITDFVESMHRLTHIELKLMTLPKIFFEILLENVKCMRVRFLSFEGTPLREVHIQLLRQYLIESIHLEHLQIPHCSIDQFQFPVIADGMHKSKSLKSFNCSRLLGGKSISLDTSKIAYLISSLLQQNKLIKIEMEMCEFVAHDMSILGEYLADKCCKLRKLNLSCNKLAADGAEFLFRYISQNRSNNLSHLNISTNGLGPHGGRVVWKYLTSCRKLKYLDISNNQIDADAMNQILTSFKKPIKILQLKLWGNKFDSRSGLILQRLLDARVLPQESIDITAIYDEVEEQYRVIRL